ncbi:MAG: RHS repeat-associated core domain-containing protein, partial [Chlorobium sp.]
EAEFGDTSLQLLGINDEGPAGILSPGAEGSFQLFFKPNFSGGGTVNLGISSLKPGEVIDWNTILDASKPDNISLDAWATVKANLIAELGVTSTDYQNNLAENATYLDQLETRTDDIAKLFSLEYLKATDGGALLRPATLGALGYSHTFAWEITAARQLNGSLLVDIAGTQVRFEHNSDGSYTLVGQGSSTLTETGGAFEFHQQNGTSIAFNRDGNFAEIRDSNNHNVQATYDGGHLTNVVADNGYSLSFIYDNAGRLIQQTDQAGRTVSFAYDANNQHLTSVTTPDGITEYGYVTEPGAAQHQVSSIKLADGTVQHFEYDASGQLIKESVNNGTEAVTYSYVGINEVIATDSTGTSAHLWLNENGQIAQIEDALGNVSQLRYDANGNLTGIANADGTATGIEYDAGGNPLSVQDALGHKVDFAYETQFGQLAVVTDQRGNAIDYGYDSHGNLNQITYADGSSETYNYDTDGDLNVAVNRRGESVTYTFDDKGQLTQKSYADGSTATYSYDAHGNLTSAIDADSSSSFQYDSADRLVKVTDGDGRWLSYTYDDAGRRTEMADQAGHVTYYSYDDLGHLSQLTDGAGNLVAAYSYDAAGRLSHGENGNGTYTTYDYDLAGQLTHLVNFRADGTVNSRFDYTYDEMGRRTDVATLDGTTHYNYDAIGQLTGVTLPDGHHIEYHYDAAGNRTVVDDESTTTSYATNTLNQYTNSSNATYSYDADGNMTGKTEHGVTTTYGYDAENHLVSVVNPTDTWSYEYDALGNRIASFHNGERIEYQLDPTGMVNVVGEYNSTGDEVARYTYGIGLESQILSGSNYYYDFNAIGSTAGLSGSTSAYVNQYSYLPFGENIVTSETVANSFEYVGQWGVMDAGNGLDFMRARFYNEEDGRFIQQDPIGVNGGLNLYGYTLNAPINYSDPTGYVIWSQVGKGALSIAGGALFGLGLLAATPAVSVGFVASGILTACALYNTYSIVGGTVVMLKGFMNEKTKFEGSFFKDLGTFSGNETAIWVGDVADNVFSIVTGRILGTKSLKLFELGVTRASTLLQKTTFTNDVVSKAIGNWEIWANVYDKWTGQTSKTVSVVQPKDPNDIIGPKGFGDENWTSTKNALGYTIRYENQETATAPAQQVTITQTLDSDLNLGSFRLGNFGWGDISITVPDNTSFYIDRLDLRSTKGYMVDVVAGVDVAKHEAYWSFTTIDPNTGEIPEDPTIGFLPTNVEKGSGEGFVNYSIRANAEAPTGTVIDAKATIVFTTQEPIDTPAISNTLDTQAPESHVEAVNNTIVESAQFLLRWSGSDVGSAIAGYTVYASDNGGESTPWLENTSLTEATYAGQSGHSYAFYTVASDNAGNKEAAPEKADLTIQVTDNAALTDMTSPKISSVVLPADGLYSNGQALDIAVHFTETMVVDIAGLSPVIKLTIGNTDVEALYQSGSGTNTLLFRHIVADGETDTGGISLGPVIQTNGATLRDVAGNPLFDFASTHNLSGNITFWKTGATISGVTAHISSTTDTSQSDGSFTLPNIPSGTRALTPTLPPDTTDKGTVDLLDAITILKSIVGLTPLNHYQEIAADFDKSDGVDLNDAIGILKHVVGLPAPTPEWVFLDKSDTIPFLEPIMVDLTSDTTVDLVGILRGDVDGSWFE